jgi:predicted RNA-binding protein YlqC (UPF0109 family)
MSTSTFFVPKKAHGELIGKGGATIKKLQEDYKVEIRMPRKEDGSDEVVVIGVPSDIEKLRHEFERLLGFKVDLGTRRKERTAKKNNKRKPKKLVLQVSEKPIETVLLDIPRSSHGLIIGKGGAILKQIQTISGRFFFGFFFLRFVLLLNFLFSAFVCFWCRLYHCNPQQRG